MALPAVRLPVVPALRMPSPGCSGVSGESTSARLLDARHAGPARAGVERFIAARYAQAYGACIDHFQPTLLALAGPQGELVAAAGFAAAAAGELFLERYLDAPVERALAARTRFELPRNSIVEVGNLAASRPGHTRELVRVLTALLCDSGFDWVVFTATRQVRNAIARCGLLGYDLGRASADAPGIDATRWGTYYANDPRVIAGSLRVAAAALGTGTAPIDAAR